MTAVEKKPARSFVVMNEGGSEMWEDMKQRSLGTIRVVTDDTEIALGLLVRTTLKTIVVATYTPTRQDIETRQTGRRYRCQVLQIPRNRIVELVALN